MRVLLNHFSVTMILGVVVGSDVNNIDDLSDVCSGGRNIYSYLTSGAGSSDKSVAMLAAENKLDCTLIYSVKAKHHVMIVLEFPDMDSQERVCVSEQNTSVMVSDYNVKQTCQYNGFLPLYYRLSYERIAIKFKNVKEMKTVKVTATSLRDAEELNCSTRETECIFAQKMFCMTYDTVCDGNINCGVPGFYDEDIMKCKGSVPTVSMIFGSLVMVVISVILFVSIWITLLPKRREVFVYKFDQTMSLFDNENGIVNVDIDIEVLLPRESMSQESGSGNNVDKSSTV